MLAYEILCISTNCCTNQRNGIEKTGMPDALALLNVNDVHHLKHLVWMVYDGILLVGPWPELLGDCSWCTVLVGLHQHIYRGCDDAVHCLPDARLLGLPGVNRGTALCGQLQLHTKWVEMSIPAPEEVL